MEVLALTTIWMACAAYVQFHKFHKRVRAMATLNKQEKSK